MGQDGANRPGRVASGTPQVIVGEPVQERVEAGVRGSKAFTDRLSIAVLQIKLSHMPLLLPADRRPSVALID